jgi:N-acyl-phosphatidylethanolamine-hydrolysing phospholipase D
MAPHQEYSFCPKKNNRFLNPHIEQIRRGLFDFILWKIGYFNDQDTERPFPADFFYPLPQHPINEEEPYAVWINHCTYLIHIEGINILTDPIWSQRCSPFSFFGPKRRHLPALTLNELPPIHIVFISHNHYDHLDKKTVLALHARYPDIIWLVPLGVREWFLNLGISKVFEKGWWQEIFLNLIGESQINLKATAVPAQHFSGRKGFDLNRSLWVGWVMEFYKGRDIYKRCYFVGDTGYNPFDFKKIGDRWHFMDLSLIPIGTYVPRRFMSPMHIEPQHAVHIHQEVGSKLSLAMHWKTFHLSDEPLNRPPYDLFLALQEHNLSPYSFLAIDPGMKINW